MWIRSLLAAFALTFSAVAGLTLAPLAGRSDDTDPASQFVIGTDMVVVVHDDLWPRFNWAAFDQDKVVSWANFQYSIYWNADKELTIVRRNLETDRIQTLVFPMYVLGAGGPKNAEQDGHRNTVIGISPGDGRLHFSWDHHVNPLHYARSRAGFITDPPEVMTLADFEPEQPITADAPPGATYPRFFNDRDENLYFLYRRGVSGNGDIVYFSYDHESGTWSMNPAYILGREGVYPDWEDSQSRNAYLHDVLYDNRNRLHLTWVYREKSASWASNHDLHYAFSDDRGLSWHNNAGEAIADTRKGESVVIDSPGIRVRKIPVYSWLMNQCGMTIDSRNRPHIATFHLDEPFIPEKLAHNPPREAADQLRYYHYWRTESGEWLRSDPLPMIGGRRRPAIVTGPGDEVIIYFSTVHGFFAHIALPEDQYRAWRTIRLTGPDFRVNDLSKPDRRRLREENILSFTADPKGRQNGSGFAFLDFDLGRILNPKSEIQNPKF